MRRVDSDSEADTQRLGQALAGEIGPHGIVLLEGDLGSGKTVLVRGLARALGVDPREIQSPTYTLIHEHEGSDGRLVHVDLYRLEGDEIDALGLDELLAGPGIKAIEWAERLTAVAGEMPGAARVRLERTGSGSRRITITGG